MTFDIYGINSSGESVESCFSLTKVIEDFMKPENLLSTSVAFKQNVILCKSDDICRF